MTERVTLKPGDYVLTHGMTQDQYHAVAKEFLAAGAKHGEYPEVMYMEDDMGTDWAFGYREDALWHGLDSCFEGRHLTIDQVLTATNAGGKTQDTLTTILESAAEHDAKAKHHAAEHERLMQQARDMLPDGWRLVRAEDMVQTVSEDPRDWIKGSIEDMDDPYEWEEWEGGECPVEEGTLVDVRYRSGKEELALEAGMYNQGRESEMVAVDWSHSGSKNDIVAYRVCPT